MANTDPATVDFAPAMTREQVFESEAKHTNDAWRVSRRVAMLTLTRSRDELLDGYAKMGDDVLIEMIECVDEYYLHMKAGAELAQAALARLLCVASAINEAEA